MHEIYTSDSHTKRNKIHVVSVKFRHAYQRFFHENVVRFQSLSQSENLNMHSFF